MCQTFLHSLKNFCFYFSFQGIPEVCHIGRLFGAFKMCVVNMLNHGLPCLQLIGVRNIVEKQQKFFRTGLHIFIHGSIWLPILLCVTGSFFTPANSHPQVVGPVVSAPSVIFVAVYIGTIVVIGVYHPADSQRRGILFISLPGHHQHLQDLFLYFPVMTKGTDNPFFRYLFCGKGGVETQSAESEEIGCRQIMPCPVLVISGVDHCCDSAIGVSHGFSCHNVFHRIPVFLTVSTEL